jgi:hypothetical protein
VYRAGAPEAVVQPPNLILTTPACATDDTPPLAQIIYYLVVPDPGS